MAAQTTAFLAPLSGARRAAPRLPLAFPLRVASQPFTREVASKLSSEGSEGTGSADDTPVRIVVSFLRATQLRSSPSMPIYGNKFEYMMVSRDLEGEEWSMGDAYQLPGVTLRRGEDVLGAIRRVVASFGLEESRVAVYPEHYLSPVYVLARQPEESPEATPEDTKESVPLWTPDRSILGTDGKALEDAESEDAPTRGWAASQENEIEAREQAEVLVIVDPGAEMTPVGDEAFLWFDTDDILAGWGEATGGRMTLESDLMDGTFSVGKGKHRINEEVVPVLARAEQVREMLGMAIVTDATRAADYFSLLQALMATAGEAPREKSPSPEGGDVPDDESTLPSSAPDDSNGSNDGDGSKGSMRSGFEFTGGYE